MKEWKIKVVQTVYESVTVYVDAETEEEAYDLGLEKALDEEHWECDEINDREVLTVEELEVANG